MPTQWDRPANEHHPSLPANRTLRQYGKDLKRRHTIAEIRAILHLNLRRHSVCTALLEEPKVVFTKGRPVGTGCKGDLPPRLRERIAAAYGMSVEQYRAVKEAGLTVRDWHERVRQYQQAA